MRGRGCKVRVRKGRSKCEEYEAESILERRYYFGCKFYLVKWKNFSTQHNTWQPVDNLMGVINQVLVFDYQLKKQFMVDRYNWTIQKIKLQVQECQRHLSIRKIVCNNHKLASLEITLQHLKQSQADVEHELQLLLQQFRSEELKVTLGSAKEPMAIEIPQQPILQPLQISPRLNSLLQDNKLLVEIDNRGQLYILAWNEAELDFRRRQPDEADSEKRLLLEIDAARKRADARGCVPLAYNFFDFEGYLDELNDEQLVASRKKTLKLLSEVKPFGVSREERLCCNTAAFNSFTCLRLDDASLALAHIEITQKQIKGCLGSGGAEAYVDLHTILVYYPKQLLESFQHLF